MKNLAYHQKTSGDRLSDFKISRRICTAIAQYVLHHHERWDGTGYPAGLRGEQIPFQSRIIAVADAYEAMTAKRSYQKTLTNEEAIKELRAFSNTQFDPAVVKIFLEVVISEEQENNCDLTKLDNARRPDGEHDKDS